MKNSTDIYRKLILLMIRSRRHMFESIEERKMTPVQGMLMMLFSPGESKSMQKLSELMGCDASNITGLVDRLDAQQLIERTVDPADRRVKMIKLSEKGIQCREEILKGLRKAEAVDVQQLTPEEQVVLVRIIDKLTSDM